MSFFDKFPYSNFQELNLDWIMQEVARVRDNRDASDASAAAALESENNAKASETAAAASAQASAESAEDSAESATAAAGSEAASAEYLDQIGTHAAGAVADWLEENLQPTTPPVDATLTVSGAAADAKVTGDRISDLNDSIGKIANIQIGKNLFNFAKSQTGYIQSDGSISTNGSWASYSTSSFIPVDPESTYIFTFENKLSGTAEYSTRKGYLLYNASKQPISETYVNESGGALIINTGSAKYIRIAGPTNVMDPNGTSDYAAILQEGSALDGFEPYTETVILTMLAQQSGDSTTKVMSQKAVTDSLSNIAANLENTETKLNESIENKPNLVNLSSAVTGAVQSNGTITSTGAWETYKTSDYISIEQNTDYGYTQYRSDGVLAPNFRKVILAYDANKNPLPATYVNYSESVNTYIFNSGNAYFVRVSWSDPVTPKVAFSKGTETPQYSEYGYKLSDQIVNDMSMQFTGGNLYGKKWAVIGDSFTNGATSTLIQGGKYDGQRYVYPYLVGNRTGINILKFFEGGRTLAFPAEPGTFTNSITNPNADFYYQNIPEDADYITIYLGINDGHHAPGSSGGDGEDNTGVIPIGTLDDQTTATFGGAWNVVLTWLLTNRPNAHIGIIVSNGLDTAEYMTMTINAAKKYGLPYLNLNGDERCRAMIRSQNPDIPEAVKNIIKQTQAVDPASNTHPNDAAHLLESTFIENFLRTL